MSKKVAIFGPGWLGNTAYQYLQKQGHEVVLIERSQGDIANIHQVRMALDITRPDVVVNTVGKTGRPNIDWCEASSENKRATVYSNVTGPMVLGQECAQRGLPLVHFSSGCIFNGASPKEGGFTEEDIANPNSFYGWTKARADEMLLAIHPDSLIFRIRMPISGDVNPRNLIYKLSHYSKVVDVLNSVTVIDDLMVAINTLIEKEKTGIYNAVNPTPVYHKQILAWYRELVDPAHTYKLVPAQEIANLATTGRSNCVLNTDKLLRDVPGVRPAPWAIGEALVLYGEELKKKL